jgi:hypothetical protein
VLSTFDAPTREFCRVRRDSTTTPLQSLALMNETGFLEAARVLSETVVREFGNDEAQRVDHVFRLLTSKHPAPEQSAALVALIKEGRDYYSQHPDEAAMLLAACGEHPIDQALPPVEVASTLLMARAVLNIEPCIDLY